MNKAAAKKRAASEEHQFFLMAPGQWENEAAGALKGWYAIGHEDFGIFVYAWNEPTAERLLDTVVRAGAENLSAASAPLPQTLSKRDR